MPEYTSANQGPVRLLPVTMPGPAVPAVGAWHGRGLCIGENPDVFFPSHGDPGTEARRICGLCPVRHDCLEYSTEADEDGIWGGLDQGERRNLRRKQRRRTAAAPITAAGKQGKAEGAA
jgi:hypothetical protein